MRIALVDDDPERRAFLAEEVRGIGCELACERDGSNRVLAVVSQVMPDLVVVGIDAVDAALLDGLAQIRAHAALPVVIFADRAETMAIDAAIACGVSALAVDGLARGRVRSILEVARARYARCRELETELEQARRQLSERKLIERAKGLLTAAHGVSEDEAYRAMRQAAMRSNRRLAEVAEQILDRAARVA
jgi:response regulator NasT